jgi:Ni/Co efflux regulator RcnB
MNVIRKAIAVTTLSVVFASTGAFAQEHYDLPNNGYVRHTEWRKGGHIAPEDWNRGQQVDWHAHHLNAPPHGYEWRQVDGNFVLAAAATGIIAATIIAAGH